MTTLASELLDAARQQSDQAQQQVQVSIRVAESAADSHLISALFAKVWHTTPDRSPVAPNLIRALSFAGAYVTLAETAEGQVLGASVALLSAHGQERGLHSHVTGVAGDARSRGVGYALKLHQRAWALDHGLDYIHWTFDPLVARNAAFNVRKLGAGITAYIEDFYGEMYDGVNAGNSSDRLVAHWQLRSDQSRPLGHANAVAVLRRNADGAPEQVDAGPAATVSVALPVDITELRASDQTRAERWRVAVRDALVPRLAAGWSVCGFDADRGYLLAAPR